MDCWVRKILKRREWLPTPVLLPSEFLLWTEKPAGIQSMALQRFRQAWVTNNLTFTSKAITWSKESFFKLDQLDIPMKSNEFRKSANSLSQQRTQNGYFPGGSVVKTSLSNAGGVGSIPGQQAKIRHVVFVQSPSCVPHLATLRPEAHRAFMSFTLSLSFLKLKSTESVMHSNISPSVAHFSSCPHSLLGSGFFSNESALYTGWQNIGPSTSVLPIIRVNFLLGWLVWSPCSLGDSQESSPTPQFKCIHSLAFGLLYGPILTSIHDYWKNHSLDYTDLCWRSDVSAF